jgi:hypothetical protein
MDALVALLSISLIGQVRVDRVAVEAHLDPDTGP